ncbi:GNAT family N-acetyltransferase [Neolewinella antarctica]|uniref:GNAT superfamily N-acetyltransferase n=1 Tax=Neolewinella antarctica TaxID=442734 RepID=A0ABX0XAA8_9BACT|nr:GNAT family N-acetyltransferase [Neolewinella antarctica]NJC26170.1 GNAT superfamily N-acetyltransferase [Neolewinella antarctica]
MPTLIRQATPADLPAVHGLVAELAAYVDSLPQFTATLADYEKDMADGFYEVLVAETEGKVIGMALYYYVYSTWRGRMIYLEDFVLAPAHRRRGVGQQLWDALIAKGRGRGCKLLKWQIAGQNTEALKFYAAQDATIENDWLNGKLFL